MTQKIERPPALKLIVAYIVLSTLLAMYLRLAGFDFSFGLGTVLLILGTYYGLWKMRKDWMWLVVFIMSVSTIMNVIVRGLDLLILIYATINAFSIFWLWDNRDIFKEPVKGKSILGTRSEWKRVGIGLLGFLAMIVSVFILPSDYVPNAAIVLLIIIPLWAVFVWLILPKVVKGF